jgi:4-hydroxy-tetrahydrodipicolinate synthase
MSPDEMREQIKAVVIVMATPFNQDGSVDFDGLEANTRFLVERCQGKRFVLVPTGSTGEYYAMHPEEQIRVIETVIQTVDGQLPVVAGTAAAGTPQTIALSQAAERAGADGVQIVLPFYHVPSEEGLYRHYVEIADALHIGLMIYNNPAVSKLWMPPHVMARCAQHPVIVADKENTPDVTQYKAMRDAVDPQQMSVLCGLGDLQFAYAAALGCPGFVTWTANFAPEYSLALLDAADAEDFGRVRDIISKTGRLYEFVGTCAQHRGRDPWVLPGYASGHIYVGIMKAAMELMGLAGGPVRGPGDDLTPDERGKLGRLMIDIGLLEA